MKSHFKFNKQERSGIFFLLLIIFILQGVYFYVRTRPFEKESSLMLNTLAQSKMDSLKKQVLSDTPRIFPFNPNYIDDYKGYRLGMSPDEIDRLLAYRRQNKYVSSAEEFQAVTKISDSLLRQIRPYFKFPVWKNQPKSSQGSYSSVEKTALKQKGDLNKASAEELAEISGIGSVLSKRIIKFRDRLGGFAVDEQLYDVYGLEVEVADRALQQFEVIAVPHINKIDVNKATVAKLSNLVYINRAVAQRIVAYREANGRFESLDELLEIEDFPRDRIDRIKLYLQL